VRPRWATLLPWALGFVAYQLVNPGYIDWWVSGWTHLQSWLHFAPQSWMSASILSFAVAAVATLPAGCSWSATGIGRTSLAGALASLSAGGHLRVGMEDTLTFARGRPVTGNDQLVHRAAELARLAQRPPMTTDEARALLRVKDRTTPETTGDSR
jgi:hypothetical protein